MSDSALLPCTFDFCHEEVPRELLQIHVDGHVAEQLAIEQALQQKQRPMPTKRKFEEDKEEPSTKRTCTSLGFARDRLSSQENIWGQAVPPTRRGRDVLRQLQLRLSEQKNKDERIYLSSLSTEEIVGEFWDKGWSCGYRNCQMLLSFLEKQEERSRPLVRHVPDIVSLQRLLEAAWKEAAPTPRAHRLVRRGYDPAGASQLDHRVHETRKWIGTTEVYVMLTYLGIRCTILDFDMNAGRHDILLDWVQHYYESALRQTQPSQHKNAFERLMHASACESKSVHLTDRPPIYLQHQGHSRTIVGIETSARRRTLICFDPGRRLLRRTQQQATAAAAAAVELSPHTFRVDAKAIAKNDQYQLLVPGHVVDGRTSTDRSVTRISWQSSSGYLLTDQEQHGRKYITSIRVT
ncbi:peptidase family C78-domain-containing protein [Syncephalastrum racemosum]|uniref:Peptidase family C78-domain-containing protein n=1 Tax=Syncephalastrum racemosum TaxID=13706 RepID=A0A1X2H5W3_SYNRA|nr:peptidase family C78-domain-containing protein [Syncephalastrum racemosum]